MPGQGSSGWMTVIGLEIHARLKTESKLFCGCRAAFGSPPNTNVCPVCLGLPGALPVVNGRAVELAVRAALGLNCEVHPRSVFARKNYFYPDLPKGYQITQYGEPLATHGSLAVANEASGDAELIRIRRLHIEEDTGKSLHDRFPMQTAVDLNRAGVPLIEIVTEPDLSAPGQARTFLVRLKQILEYLEVSDCNMEEGSLRVDANVSVRPEGSSELMTKTEVKNLNSFSQVAKALEYEATRHIATLKAGGKVEATTMLWDAAWAEARPMRGKEEVHDYRYFPEPDLSRLEVEEETIRRIQAELPELPQEKAVRLALEYGLPAYNAQVLSSTRALADYYEIVAQATGDPKTASNWVMGEVLAACNDRGVSLGELGLEPDALAGLITLIQAGALSNSLGKQVMRKMIKTGKTAERIVLEEDLRTVGDAGQIEAWVADTIAKNPDEVARYRAGEEKLLAFFMGQVMRRSEGRADPDRVREILAIQLAVVREERDA